ncbi:MAG: hypothetical protein ABI960_06545 [Candidatus Eisenbacteria bacterium]
MAVGIEWTYAVGYRQRTRAEGESEFGPWREQNYSRVNRCVRKYTDRGKEYFSISERTRELEPPYREFVGLNERVRQDAAGLYSGGEGGGLATLPRLELAPGQVGRPAPGPAPFERVVLRYPLHVGQAWSQNGQGGALALVEAIEPIRTPFDVEPAARVRRTPAGASIFGDPELSWYGRSGLLRTFRQLDSDWKTPQGTRIGDRQEEVVMSLVSFRRP